MRSMLLLLILNGPIKRPALQLYLILQKKVTEYPPNPTIAAQIQKSLSILEALKVTRLFRPVENQPVLSSTLCRLKQTTIGTLLATANRDSLNADCCLVHGGGIRARQDFPDGLTFADILKLEPYNNDFIIVKMTGKDLIDIVKYSRRHEGVEESSDYLQVDDGIIIDDNKTITHIASKPIDPDHHYTVSFAILFLGLKNEFIKAWVAQNGTPNKESARPEQSLALQYLSKLLWKKLPPFEVIDKNGDGDLSKEEVMAAYKSVFPVVPNNEMDVAAVQLTVKTLIESMDKDGNERLSKEEYMGLFGGR